MRRVAALAVAFVLAGCAPQGQSPVSGPATDTYGTLQVKSLNWERMTVHIPGIGGATLARLTYGDKACIPLDMAANGHPVVIRRSREDVVRTNDIDLTGHRHWQMEVQQHLPTSAVSLRPARSACR